jgi:hypothetical protein
LRQLFGAWFVALALVGGTITLLFDIGGIERRAFSNVKIAVIGSSPTRYAIAANGGGATSLLGDGRRHTRFGLRRASEYDLLVLLKAAIDDRVELALVEVSPLIRDTRDSPEEHGCNWWRGVLRGEHRNIARSFRRLLGAQTLETREPARLDRRFQLLQPDRLRAIYPLRLHQPLCRARLDRLLARARAQGTTVAFFLPPRSRAADGFLPSGEGEQLERLAKDLASELQVPAFVPKGPWSNSLFIDHGHLNRGGRQRFDAELRDWWAGRE